MTLVKVHCLYACAKLANRLAMGDAVLNLRLIMLAVGISFLAEPIADTGLLRCGHEGWY